MHQLRLAFIAALALIVSGCATKNYGRQGDVTDFERRSLTCREIDIETAKVHGFLKHVDTESEFDGRSVLSFLGDFGVGNVMEKSSAMESATKRLAQLQQARSERNCNAANEAQVTPSAPAQEVATAPSVQVAGPADTPTGKDSFQVQRLAKEQACSSLPVPALMAKGPGFESYSVPCSNGDAMIVRCEFGNCRVLK